MQTSDPLSRRQHTYRLEAVVLRHQDLGEADRLIWLYSLEQGKLRAIAKGVRKLHSRKAGHLEPFTQVALLLARGKELPIITQAETQEAYLPLRDDLLLSTCASYVMELMDRFTHDEEENRSLYRLLTDTLKRLCQPWPPELVLRFFELHFLDHIGFRPQLFHCVECGEAIQPQNQFFSAQQGGVLCPRCGAGANERQPVTLQGLKYLRHYQRSSFTQAMQGQPPEAVRREMEGLLQYYLTYLLERSLNTPAFFRRLRPPPGGNASAGPSE